MSIESESLAYDSSMYGGRPTFPLTHCLGDDAGATLYELITKDLADRRQKRFRKANSSRKLSRESLTDAIPNVQEDSNGVKELRVLLADHR